MSDLDAIYSALQTGMNAVQRLENRAIRGDDWDFVNNYRCVLNNGLSALEKLRGQLRDGRKHIEPPDDFRHTECYCNTPTCSPPCSWCTGTKEHDEEDEMFHPNDD